MEKITYQEASKLLNCSYHTIIFSVRRGDLSQLASKGVQQYLIKEQVELFVNTKQITKKSLSEEQYKLWVKYDQFAKNTIGVSEDRYNINTKETSYYNNILSSVEAYIKGKNVISVHMDTKDNEVVIKLSNFPSPSTPSDNSYRGTGLQAPEHDNTGVLTLTKEKKEEVLTQLRYEETHDITSFYYISKLLNRTYNTIIINQDKIEEAGKKVYDIDNGEIKKELDAMLELQIKLLRENELIGTNVIELVTMGKNDIETFKETHAI